VHAVRWVYWAYVSADFTPPYRRLLTDDLAAEIAAEEAREQTERSRTNDLLITTVEDQEEWTEPTNVTYLSNYIRANGRVAG
jgi:hypothetical protein